MDIDLLSKMVKELIMDNERVVLPGLGSFVAEIVPASFSDKGYTINPPYRKLYFRSKPDDGSMLIPFYAKSNSVSEEIAEKVIVDFVTELKAILFHKKTIIFPGLGRLRATKENNVFFVADEDLDIYPEGFGLEPISLKTHQATVSEVREAVSDLKSILTEPVAEVLEAPVIEIVETPEVEMVESPVVEPEVEVPVVEQVGGTTSVEEVTAPVVEEPLPTAELVEEAEQAAVKKPVWKTVLKVVMWMAIVLVALTVAYVAVSHLCPQWIDQFLYTPEELELLNNIYE